MDFAFSLEQEALRDLARTICQDHATQDRLKAIERQPDWFDRELWAALAKANLLGVALPEDVGGSGLGLEELCLLLEQVGAAVAPVPAWSTLVLGALPIAEFGTAEQRQRWLTPVVAGDAILSAALVELPAEEPAQPQTRAVREGVGWRLDGVKDCVPAAHLAAVVLVPASIGENELGVFLVEPSALGVTLEREVATNKEPQARMTLAGVRLGADALLGDATRGRAIVDWLVDRSMLGLCALELGVAERALRITAEYTKERKQFDRPIGSFQAVQQRAADAWIDVEAIRLTTWQAAWRLDRGLPARDEVTVAKFWAADAGHRIVYAAQHLHGGIGVDVDYPIHRYYLWSKALELTLGSGARQLARLGESLAAER
jgi:alkylation response protein AidB-like acyl-CoA dehydrogenase